MGEDIKKIQSIPRVHMNMVDFRVNARYLWENYYGDIIAIVRSQARCSEERAIEISHGMYVVLSRTKRMNRWVPGVGCSLSSWFVMSLRSFLSAEARHQKIFATNRLPEEFDRCSSESSSDICDAKELINSLSERFPRHKVLIDLIAKENNVEEISRVMGLSRGYVSSVRKKIQKELAQNK